MAGAGISFSNFKHGLWISGDSAIGAFGIDWESKRKRQSRYCLIRSAFAGSNHHTPGKPKSNFGSRAGRPNRSQ
jgi:hypothetical protein